MKEQSFSVAFSKHPFPHPLSIRASHQHRETTGLLPFCPHSADKDDKAKGSPHSLDDTQFGGRTGLTPV